MSGIMGMLVGAVVSAVTDAYFKYVTLLLPGNGTNGAQNNTFLDSSTNNFTITRNGNTSQGTFAPFGNLWSNYFNNSTGLALAYGTATHTFWNNDFTVEFWVNCGPKSFNAILSSWLDSDFNGGSWQFAIVNGVPGVSNRQSSGTNQGSFITAGSTRVDDGLWHHVAITQVTGASKTFRMFVDGVLRGYKVENNWTQGSANSNIYIGTQGPGTFDEGSRYYLGYASNIRLVTSVVSAYSTSSTTLGTTIFTPPTSPLTAITNTNILTCQSNRFIDNSSNNFTITRNGDVSVQRFSPFNPTASYTPSTDGGSGFFDGTGDYLTAPSNAAWAFGTGDFTVEAWIYPRSFAIYEAIASNMQNGSDTTWGFLFNSSGGLRFQSYFIVFLDTNTSTVTLNAWNHVVAVRSGSNGAIFINGTRRANSASFTNNLSTSATLFIGRENPDAAEFDGYISSLRIVKGTAVYDPTASTITVPTSPLTAITNTQLLTNFTNAGIIDNAEMNNLETVGNAQISTAQSKFGGGSMLFDGSGDTLATLNTPNLRVGSGNFTIEFWVYFNAVSGNPYLMMCGNAGATTGFYWYLNGSNSRWELYIGSTAQTLQAGSAPATGQWYHVALVRNGSALTMYVNGSSVASATNSSWTDETANPFYIGSYLSSNYYLNAYIDDLRITKGYARYTSNFSVPTTPFPTQ